MAKLEEALEIKSLRRVISAYLNYAVAMEDDVKRWERSYRKLRPAHKELLSHLPEKYEGLRRCLSANFCFIINMLQAFEPPFDMSQDCDTDQQGFLGHTENGNHACSNSNDRAGICTGIDLNPPFVPTESVNSVQPHLPSIGSPRSSRENITQLGGQEVENGRYLEQDFIQGLNRVDDHRCIDGMSEGRPEIEDTKSAEMQKALSNTKKVTVCGMDFQDPALQLHVPPADVDKVRCIIRNIVRDWTTEGALERDQCYKPILEELNCYFPNRSRERPPCCVVPGAGLARLACEISCLGFVCQGNEFSYYVLICSSFILNNTQVPMEWVIYPWIHSNCNTISDENQLRSVYFPDLHPGSAGITDGFSMCAGDFVEVYSHSGQEGMWDAVVTCFFIDTAHNIVEYIEIIAKILKPGGVWINLGPLLYHFADALSYSGEEEMSVELSLEDVKKVASHYGLKLQKERTIETTYTANQRSMIQTRYSAAFWTMTKDGDGLTAKDVQH